MRDEFAGVPFTNLDLLTLSITSNTKGGVKLFIHSHTSVVKPLKFGDG